jgi:outer membrane beta-barrel protein
MIPSLRSSLLAVTALAALVFAPAAHAQDDDDFDLDDIIGTGDDTQPQTVGAERAALLTEPSAEELPPPPPAKRRVIQTHQRKNFMKIGRYEAAPMLGFVTNDPFINRYLLGGGFGYHITEIFAVEATGFFSPDLGEADYKPITVQITEQNQVTPDISKIQYFGNVNFQFSPIYGKVAVLGNNIVNFDIFGVFGTGVVNTRDDLEALDKTEDLNAQATQVQIHPTINFGGGLRIILSEGFALRLEGRGVSFIEVLEGSTLEMKNNFTMLAGASFFFPGME